MGRLGFWFDFDSGFAEVWRFLLGLLLLLFVFSGWISFCVGFVCLVCCFSVVVGWRFTVVGFWFLFVTIAVIFICVCYLVVWCSVAGLV